MSKYIHTYINTGQKAPVLRKGGGAGGAGGKKAAKQAGEQLKNVEFMKRVGSQSSSAARASSALPGVCVWERERVCVCLWERERDCVCDYLCVRVRMCMQICVCDDVCALPGACAHVYEHVCEHVCV